MRLLTIAFTDIKNNLSQINRVNYDEKYGAEALEAMALDLNPLYKPGYIDANNEVFKNQEAISQAFLDLKNIGQQSKSLSETTFTNKGGEQSEGVDAVKSMSTDVEALNHENQ